MAGMSEHGRYTIDRKIAEGGMAEIFLGTQHGAAGFQRPVIVKRIHAVFSASPQFRNMFVDEAHIAMSLNQGNIVQVLDLGMVGGRYFLILELVDGWDLNKIFERAEAAGLALPPELALYVVAEVGRGLAYAHGREREGKPLGIVHRDVSPHNVLISEQGEVKLSDFGIATAENRREQTLAGTVKGKIGFMSPEQASGKAIDARSDVFSLGATLYHLLTGKRPFAARSDLEALLRTQACDFPGPLVAKPDLHPEVAKIVEKAMKKSPLARYQSAEQMLLDLERVQRAVLKPVGKTELKSWLSELGSRDGAPPTSRAEAFASDAPAGDLPLDGSVIVLQDSDLERPGARTLAGVEPPPVPGDAPASAATARAAAEAAAEAMVAAEAEAAVVAAAQAALESEAAAAAFRPTPVARDPFAAIPPTMPVDTLGAPVAPPRARWGLRIALAALILAVVGGGTWAALRVVGYPPPQTAAVTPPPAPAPVPAPMPESAPASQAASLPAVAGTQPASAPATQVAAATEAATAGSEDQVPDEEAAPEAEAGKPAPKAKAAKPAAMVPVKLVSIPPGASVRVARRSFGVTPRSLHFRAGLTYQLIFEKQGYVPVRRLVRVSPRGGQTVKVAMQKGKKKGWLPW
jgi:eukaryotic-like serine/threonine-protein kinase